MVIAEGKVMNPNFLDYLLPTASDIPKVDVITVEEHEPTGPYGAKGIAEPPNVPTTPAIINAIRNATGAVIKILPATPDRVLKALSESMSR
jgi:CO/xanthine dehydrogenase Mo-binding subunit